MFVILDISFNYTKFIIIVQTANASMLKHTTIKLPNTTFNAILTTFITYWFYFIYINF